MTEKNRVVVVGAGVAGTVFSYMFTEKFKECSNSLRIYDMSRLYLKPCGEAVPAETINILSRYGIPLPNVIARVNRYIISINGYERVIEFKEPVWTIISKHEWINNIRMKLDRKIIYSPYRISGKYTEKYLVIDARGPFAQPRRVLPVWQAYLEASWPRNTSLLHFVMNRDTIGLVWIFPSKKDVVNAGGGFRNIGDPRELSLNIIKKYIEINDVIDEKYSVINISPKIQLFSNCCARIGEAAGLIMPLGGEGIRPAVLSAIAAADSVREDKCRFYFDGYAYVQKIRELVSQVRTQKFLLYFAEKHPVLAARMLANTDEELFLEWLKGSISKTSLLRFLFRR